MEEKPNINMHIQINGMDVTLIGELTGETNQINSIIISWGDQSANTTLNGNIKQILVSHIFVNPATYSIVLTGSKDNLVVFSDTIRAEVNFLETSLSGIKETMFKTVSNEMLILSLNLHTYQETRQNEKFNLIADLIGMMDVDFIAFQECAQRKTSDIVYENIRVDNMARIVSEMVNTKYGASYSFVWDWSHYGWEVWEEGVAVLSKYPIEESESKIISSATSVSNIETRKIIYASCQVSEGRNFHIFSAHTHWRISETSEEQNNQVKRIKNMVSEKEMQVSYPVLSFVCGDFNANPTDNLPWSQAYYLMTENNIYSDSFLEIYPDANNSPAQSIYNTIGGSYPGRIDYIFIKNDTNIRVLDSQIIFKPDVVGVVSDHYGVLTKLRF